MGWTNYLLWRTIGRIRLMVMKKSHGLLGWVIDCAVPFAWWQRLPRYSLGGMRARYLSLVRERIPEVSRWILLRIWTIILIKMPRRIKSDAIGYLASPKSILQLAKNAAVSHHCPLRRQLGGVPFQGSDSCLRFPKERATCA